VAEINAAQSEILVQSNSFSAKPLIKALGRAHKRGVKVRVILDKADERRRDRTGAWLIAERILPQVDTGVASAHNKIMIIDRETVITGSFNFTEAAQKKNAENVVLIKGHPDVVDAYAKNWQRRLKASRPYYGTMAPVM
jgi:phosphatidylserine/phosphatidylglycerophosphate/cardiolipin synthase-like enzyme